MSYTELKKLYDDLDTWIQIGIGDDIVRLQERRLEYKSYVDEAKQSLIPTEEIPQWVLTQIKRELSTKVADKIVIPKPVVEATKRPVGKPPGGIKYGGRAKGTPNKRSLAFGLVLEETGFSIPEKAIELFNSTQDDNLKFKLLEFMSSYSRPKIKDQEFIATDDSSAELASANKSDSELLSLIK